jgi:hypothetical protein
MALVDEKLRAKTIKSNLYGKISITEGIYCFLQRIKGEIEDEIRGIFIKRT